MQCGDGAIGGMRVLWCGAVGGETVEGGDAAVASLRNGYDLEDFVTFTRHPDYDILDIQFGEMEAPDEWIDYELGSLIPIRDELMEGE